MSYDNDRRESFDPTGRRKSVAVQVNLRDDIADYDRVVEDARKATESEHHLSIMQGLRKYPKACAWSMLLSTAIM